ncbi:hypothetical protein [Metabacillus sediminilitoris]|uniref:Uncharacterized protein n=1 Tax=Metabacillus sediminilitoris TaxID=2567941 RepID=A0A4S4BUV5_9BACI|nr:hypothetical protein [Metabacillus sediminilitoris]QGQ44213.1 hypothetical protein GMB29_02200 [Metabacillus sediminilitoris]THF78177.1 hypothetical protein E6W99_16615 [Metabacillus sediminilitoris]
MQGMIDSLFIRYFLLSDDFFKDFVVFCLLEIESDERIVLAGKLLLGAACSFQSAILEITSHM